MLERQAVFVSDQSNATTIDVVQEDKAEKVGWLLRLEVNLYSDSQPLCPWEEKGHVASNLSGDQRKVILEFQGYVLLY